MEKNIFEGAKFGDKFVTRGGVIGIYVGETKECGNYTHLVIFENSETATAYKDDGKYNLYKAYDIVSRYQEQKKIDIEKACEWLYNNQPAIGDSMREYIDSFKKAIGEE